MESINPDGSSGENFTFKLRYGGKINQTLPPRYIGRMTACFENMIEDEWGMICLKEKLEEIDYNRDENLKFFIKNVDELEELVEDYDVWNLVNKYSIPFIIEIWVVKGVVGDAEDSEGSDEDFDEEQLFEQLNSENQDDEEFVKHTNNNVEYGGLENVNGGLEKVDVPYQDEELNMSDVGNYLGSDSEDENNIWPKFCPQAKMKDPKFHVSLTFKDKEQFKEALTSHAIKEDKEFFFEKDDKKRLVAKCKHATCPWQITLGFKKDIKLWKITVFKQKHDGCVRTQKNKMANSKLLAKRWKHEIKGHMDWKTNAFMEKVCIDDHLSLSKKQAWMALVKARSAINYEADEYFNIIWSYHREILMTNPQSTCVIKVSDLEEDGKQRFQRM